MRIFWRNKEGEKAPLDARFQFFSFSREKEALFSNVVEELPSPISLQLKSRSDSPSRPQWKTAVADALKQIELGVLEKVVLARETTLIFDQEVDPFRFTSALQEKTRGGALFCAELEGAQAFAGVSPERLFRRRGDHVITEAIAGTRRLGTVQAQELLRSSKDLREFQCVEDYLRRELEPLCRSPLSFSSTTVHQTAHVQHLFSETTGLLCSPVDSSILNALHPTPAVCGFPKKTAFDYLQKNELFSRNWYSGVLGWSTENASEWIVAIRSCLIEKNTVKLYAGTGIVSGSCPDAEWDELEAKIALYGDLCGL